LIHNLLQFKKATNSAYLPLIKGINLKAMKKIKPIAEN